MWTEEKEDTRHRPFGLAVKTLENDKWMCFKCNNSGFVSIAATIGLDGKTTISPGEMSVCIGV